MTEKHLPLASGAGAAAVVERLAARQQQLTAEREQRQAQLQAEADTREDVNSFLKGYQADFSELQQRCTCLSTQASNAPTTTKAELLEQLEALSLDICNKEDSISAAAYFLPPYELRSCSSQLQQLRVLVAGAKQQLQPKRKFAFSKAVARTNISTNATAQQQPQERPAAAAAVATAALVTNNNNAATTASTGTAGAGAGVDNKASPPAPSTQDQQLIASGHGFAGLTGQLLVASQKASQQQQQQLLTGQEGFVLHDLTDCDVFLLGRLSALRLQHLRRCRVYTGPVVGATFVDSCSDCVIMVASHQVCGEGVCVSSQWLCGAAGWAGEGVAVCEEGRRVVWVRHQVQD